MNTETASLLRAREQLFVKHGGLEGFRRHVQQHYRLKTVLRESHDTPIQQLTFNHLSTSDTNLLASVGKNQATVYDDMHMGDFLAMVVHFENVATQYTQGGALSACCWLHSTGLTDHPAGDTCLAVAGEDHSISVISVASAEVVVLLQGHATDIIELSSAAHLPGLLMSLSVDGVIKLWDVAAEACLLTLKTDAFSAALHPAGSHLVTGSRRGQVSSWALGTSGDAGGIKVDQEPLQVALQLDNGHSEAVDCIRFAEGEGGLLLSKSMDGRMSCYNWQQQRQQAHWRVPGCSKPAVASYSGRCSFGHTRDGAYVCAGNATGDLFVYSTLTGVRSASASQDKLSGGVKSCAVSEDCRHLLAAIGNGFLFRFEYNIATDAAEAEEAADQAAGDAGSGARDQQVEGEADDENAMEEQ